MKSAMAYSEPKEIEDEDWRLHAVTTLAEEWTSPDTGIFHPRGAKVMLAAMVRTLGEKILQFGIPNMSPLSCFYCVNCTGIFATSS